MPSERVNEAFLASHRGTDLTVALRGLTHAELLEFRERRHFGYDDDDKCAVVDALIEQRREEEAAARAQPAAERAEKIATEALATAKAANRLGWAIFAVAVATLLVTLLK